MIKTQINIPEVFCRGLEADCCQLYILYYICLGVDFNQLPNLHKKSQKKIIVLYLSSESGY